MHNHVRHDPLHQVMDEVATMVVQRFSDFLNEFSSMLEPETELSHTGSQVRAACAARALHAALHRVDSNAVTTNRLTGSSTATSVAASIPSLRPPG